MRVNHYSYIKVLSLLGISLALYLLWQQFARPSFQPCNINSFINCDAVITGEVAKTLGLPTPLYGLVGYILIFLAATYKKNVLLFRAASFGLLFCLWIAYKELVELHVICPICIACQLIMISVFSLSLLINKKARKERVYVSQ